MKRWGIVFAALSCALPASAQVRDGATIYIFDETGPEIVSLPEWSVPRRSDRQRRPSFEDRNFEALASPQLQTFSGDRELRDYVRDVRRIERRRWLARRADAGSPEVIVAQATIKCPDEECPPPDEEAVIVTASRAASPSITNNQVSGVDEGDIVKKAGDFVFVLSSRSATI